VSGSVFGAQGSSNFLSRTTAILATVFFVTSLSLAYLHQSGTEQPKSIMERTDVSEQPQQPVSAPAAPSDVPQLPQAPETQSGEAPADVPQQQSAVPQDVPQQAPTQPAPPQSAP